MKFNRTINGRTANETWDFFTLEFGFLRRNTSDQGPGGVIMASPVDVHSTRILSSQYNPQPSHQKTKGKNVKQSLRSKIQKFIRTVSFHRSLNRFFNSDAFLIRYQQEMTASGQNVMDPLKDYELASPADQGTVAFRRWHAQRLGGKMALLPKTPLTQSISQPSSPTPNMISRKEAADPWEQHTQHCPSCLLAYKIAQRVCWGTAVVGTMGLLRNIALVSFRRSASSSSSIVNAFLSVLSSITFLFVAWKARNYAKSFHEKGFEHY